jgi:catechol 2,3-dioxygenase-like lactoylglutathione lyase family enzyme
MPKPPAMTGDVVGVRYVVEDVDAALRFYVDRLGFGLEMHPAPGFAIVSKGNLRLLLNAPTEDRGGSQKMPDGTRQEPGGWSRIQVEVSDIESKIAELLEAGCSFRNELIVGVSQNKQILLQDPSGNLVELIEY